GSGQPRNQGSRIKCAVLETGRNSVAPCTAPRIIAWKDVMPSPWLRKPSPPGRGQSDVRSIGARVRVRCRSVPACLPSPGLHPPSPAGRGLLPRKFSRNLSPNLNLQNHRQNERSLGRLFVVKLFEILSDLFFDDRPVAALFDGRVAERFREHLLTFSEKPFFLDKRHSPENDLRRYFHHACLFVDSDDRKNDAVFGDMTPIPNDHFFNLFETSLIDQYSSHS